MMRRSKQGVFLRLILINTFLLAGCTSVHSQPNNAKSGVFDLLSKAKDQIGRGQFDSAEYYFLAARDLSQKLNFREGEFEFHLQYARFLDKQLRFQDELNSSKKHLDLARMLRDTANIAAAYNNMGLAYHSLGNLHASAENYMRSLALSDQNERLVLIVYSNLSTLYLDLGDSKKALFYSHQSLKKALGLKDSSTLGQVLTNVICSEIIAEQYDEAAKHLHQAIALGKKTKNTTLLLSSYINFHDLHLRKKEYEQALHFIKNGLALLNPSSTSENYASVYSGLANAYYHLGEYTLSEFYFDKAISLAEMNFVKNELMLLYLLGSDLKEKLKKYPSALDLRKKFESVKDSIYTASTASSVQHFEMKYQNSLKEKSIAQQQLKIANQQNEIQEKNKWLLLSVGSILLLAAAGSILVIRSSYKQRSLRAHQQLALLRAQIKGEEIERARQARELHDGICSLLFSVKIQLSAFGPHNLQGDDQEKYNKAISIIDYANKEVRNISHNLTPEIVLEEGIEIAIREFCKRLDHKELQINLTMVGKLPRLENEFALVVYRFVQEAVTNVVKHAQAKNCLLQISYLDHMLTITVEDDGVGFDIDRTPHNGIGLGNIMRRVSALEGICEITSAPGKGTSIYLEFNVTAPADQ